jgi:hypothetical protein
LNDIVNFRGNYFHLRAINDYSVKTGECTVQLLGPIIPDALPKPTIYYVGQSAFGGIVAYINGGAQFGTSGFVVATTDQTVDSEWGCSGVTINAVSNTDGYTNTQRILAGCATRPIAASYTEGDINGYSDWYLPSKDQLTIMYNNVGNGASGANFNIANFTTDSYWTSTAVVGNNSVAWAKGMGAGTEFQAARTVNSLSVRAIRNF